MLHGEFNEEARNLLLKCLRNSGDLRAIKVLTRIECNIIDADLQKLLNEWDLIFTEAKNIDYNMAMLGEVPVGTNQNYAVRKGVEEMVMVEKKATRCLSDILTY